jgi:S-DNA-T family DNA segregation ATPase FtsK/SpoIIIE
MAATVTRDYLNFQSNRIERVLASHRVPARVHGGTISPRWIRFHLTPAIGAKIASVRNLSEELALALGAPDVRVQRDGQQLALEVPRPDAEPVRLLPMLRGMGNIPSLTTCAGLAEDGRPLMLRLASPDVAHILVAGTTGSGKTELMRSLVLSRALTNRQSKVQVALIDPKRRGLGALSVMPHCLAPLADDARSASILLNRLVGEMERRDREGGDTPHLVVAIDELADLLISGGKELEIALVRLAQRGREAGIHLIVGVQKPSAAVIGGMLKANFPVRLVGKVGSAEDARVAAGVAGTGAERLMGRGDFIAIAAGQTIRFQAAWLPQADWDAALRRL